MSPPIEVYFKKIWCGLVEISYIYKLGIFVYNIRGGRVSRRGGGAGNR